MNYMDTYYNLSFCYDCQSINLHDISDNHCILNCFDRSTVYNKDTRYLVSYATLRKLFVIFFSDSIII